jgi:peptidyl-prolyl cis-trans isomerase D
MLEQLRRNSRSVIVWALFGIIIFIFVVSFGPQADQLTCSGPTNYALRVDGTSVQPSSWRFGMNGLGGGVGDAQERRQVVFDLLIKREILAQAAEDAGLRVSDEIVNAAITRGEFYFMGSRLDGKRRYFRDGLFDYDMFRQFSRGLGQSSTAALIEEQRREHLADKMRSLVIDSVSVSRDEVRARFIQENTRITLEHAAFAVGDYERALALREADLDAYLDRHGDQVKARFEANRRLYQDVSPQVEVRHIAVRDSDKEAARAAAERAHQRLRAGEAFAEVARDMSDDERTALRGGYMGWRPVGALGLGRAVSEATADLEVGELSEVIEADDGFVIVRFEGRREGDLEFDEVKYELARELATPHYAREAARRDAQAALERLAAGADFEDLFPERDEAEHTRAPFELGPIVPAQLGGSAADDEGEPAGSDAMAEISDEPIPRPEGLEPPARQVAGPLRRQADFIEGIGESPALVRALFDELAEGEVAEEVFEVGSAFVLAKLVSRQQADMDEFEERLDDLRENVAFQKSADVLFEWIHGRCRELATQGRLSVNMEYFLADAESAGQVQYRPCQTLSFRDIAQDLQSRIIPQ